MLMVSNLDCTYLCDFLTGDVAEKTWEVIPDFLTLTSCKSSMANLLPFELFLGKAKVK